MKTSTLDTITIEDLTELCNLTKRRLYGLAEDGRIPKPVKGRFPLAATVSALFSYYQRDSETLQREKMLKTAAERKLREHQLALAEKQFVPLVEAGRIAANIGATIRTMVIQKISRDFPVQVEVSAPQDLKAIARQEATKISETAASDILWNLHNAMRSMTGQPPVAFAEWSATNQN